MLIMKNYKDDENCRYTGTKEKIHYKFNVDINDGMEILQIGDI